MNPRLQKHVKDIKYKNSNVEKGAFCWFVLCNTLTLLQSPS